MKLIFILLIILIGCKIEVIEQEKLKKLIQEENYHHNFILLHPTLTRQIATFIEQLEKYKDVTIYVGDCTKLSIDGCAELVPVVLLYNHVVIKYKGYTHNPEDIAKWIKNRYEQKPSTISSHQQLTELINSEQDIFCFCKHSEVSAQKAVFYALSKLIPIHKYCFLNDQILIHSLGLKAGNLTFIMGNQSSRIEYQHANRYQSWELFVKQNMLPGIKRGKQIIQIRLQPSAQIHVLGIVVDLSWDFEQDLRNFRPLYETVQKKHPQLDVRLVLQQTSQNNQLFNMYYHIKPKLSQLPALLYINLNRSENSKIQRYIEYVKLIDFQSIQTFLHKVKHKEIEQILLSEKQPKKNGFIGKGSDRMIQKLVATNYNKTIMECEKHYVLLITALNIGCKQCESFFKEYKKVASFLQAQEVVLGYINVNDNEVHCPSIKQYPQLLIFPKNSKQYPKRFKRRYDFNNLLMFVQKYLNEQQSSQSNEL